MKLTEMKIERAEEVLFDIVTISMAVQFENKELIGRILSGDKLITSIKEVKSVSDDVEGNSYGFIRDRQLKHFKDDINNVNTFFKQLN
ncbi:MAG: hypothetical protein CL843_09305 [Crocinitomicaceae bacterium]|nr:hypothetical protein [Crocinitomicaceae bacterium]|tara:strand:- start:4208 stop:4471 length:264 start_codon:yes stop_codon:yes gene_type:complete